jgi:hypothetical protein
MSTPIDTPVPLYRPTTGNPTLARTLTGFVIVAIVLQSAHAAYVLAGGPQRIANFFPDDAFYYLRLAGNFARQGRWTFDGSAPATGFHLLWGYFWAAVFVVAPQISLVGIYLLSFAVGVVCYVLAAAALSTLVAECYGSAALLAVFALFLGSSLFMLPALGMESAPTLLFASLACMLLFRPRYTPWSWPQLAAVYAVGLFGMLSRSDFGVLVFACLLAYVWDSARRGNLSVRAVQPAVTCFAGAVSGLALILAHSWLVSGHLLQASAQTKYYWSSLNGHSIEAPLLLLAGAVVYKLPFAGTLMYPVLVLLAVVAAVAARFVVRQRLLAMPMLAATLAIAGYVVLYSRDSRALQLWYVTSFGAPLTIICAPALAAVAQKSRRLAIGLVGAAVAGVFVLSLRPIWPHQFAMKDAGEFLAVRPQLSPVGAWNAGLISYFAGRPVTNLDGLVNDDILPYARSGTLAEYIRERNLAYVIDYSAMLGPNLALRGGYADGTLGKCLKPEQQIDSNNRSSLFQDSVLTLYKVDSRCLESHTRRAR